ncbi:MAG: YkgJ family cysteine cluster protein [Bacillota bacterium]
MENELFSADTKFRFDCHRDLPCFGQCCRDINIFLTPYDVLRIKKRLGLSSTEFLNKYTNEIGPPEVMLPVIYLKMNEEDKLNCPFVTPNGCSLYEVRPWSCRMAPVDIAGPGTYKMAFDRAKCLGLNEVKEWTVKEWMSSQNMDLYDAAEYYFKSIPLLLRFTGEESLDKAITHLFRMVCYDTDTFKEYISKNKFLINEADINREAFLTSLKDDDQLLKSGVHWFINIAGNRDALKKAEKILQSRK